MRCGAGAWAVRGGAEEREREPIQAAKTCGPPPAPEDAEQFVDFRISRKERVAVDELGEDAADGPDVDRGGVVLGAEEHLRCAIPQGDHLVRVGANGDGERAGQAKVRELEDTGAVDQQVLGLEVAVHDAMRVAVGDAADELVQIALRESARWARFEKRRTRERRARRGCGASCATWEAKAEKGAP